jgi:hypothetical protein
MLMGEGAPMQDAPIPPVIIPAQSGWFLEGKHEKSLLTYYVPVIAWKLMIDAEGDVTPLAVTNFGLQATEQETVYRPQWINGPPRLPSQEE